MTVLVQERGGEKIGLIGRLCEAGHRMTDAINGKVAFFNSGVGFAALLLAYTGLLGGATTWIYGQQNALRDREDQQIQAIMKVVIEDQQRITRTEERIEGMKSDAQRDHADMAAFEAETRNGMLTINQGIADLKALEGKRSR